MGPPTVRIEPNETQGAGKAETILAAAKRMFLEHGFGAVSMDAIARAAGVSKATVYAHFAGKEELFGAVIGRECERYFADFSAGELDPEDVGASLTTLGCRFLDLLLSPDPSAISARSRPLCAPPRRPEPCASTIRGLPPSSLSGCCAARPSCAIFCVSTAGPSGRKSTPSQPPRLRLFCLPSRAEAPPSTPGRGLSLRLCQRHRPGQVPVAIKLGLPGPEGRGRCPPFPSSRSTRG